jgi:hypothetical protein
MKPISYTSDQGRDYCKAIDACKSIDELALVLRDYRKIFPDAFDARPKDEAEFKKWKSGLYMERHGRFAGEEFMERFGNVLLPTLMLDVGMVASQFHAPWGCAFIHLCDVGRIVKERHPEYGTIYRSKANDLPKADRRDRGPERTA